MKRLVLILSIVLPTVATAEYVTCDIGVQIMYHGKQNHLNLVSVRGFLVSDDNDTMVVNFSKSLPEEYTYLEGPELHINSNSCMYDKQP